METAKRQRLELTDGADLRGVDGEIRIDHPAAVFATDPRASSIDYDITGTIFHRCRLDGATLTGRIRRVTFIECTLRGTTFDQLDDFWSNSWADCHTAGMYLPVKFDNQDDRMVNRNALANLKTFVPFQRTA